MCKNKGVKYLVVGGGTPPTVDTLAGVPTSQRQFEM